MEITVRSGGSTQGREHVAIQWDAAPDRRRRSAQRFATVPDVHVARLHLPRAPLLLLCAFALTLAATVAGCGGSKPSREQVLTSYGQELREAISTKVADEPRKARMLAILDQLDAMNRRFTKETRDFIESYRELNADYDAPRPAFDRLFADYSAKLKDICIKAGQTPTAEQLQQLQAALASANANQAELTAASKHIQTWAKANCTG